uniref:Uncharacterized protein n=1 Tax=Rhizophora mucronata TaxID=61149 RepID=A0A2P2QUG9_RHIMU
MKQSCSFHLLTYTYNAKQCSRSYATQKYYSKTSSSIFIQTYVPKQVSRNLVRTPCFCEIQSSCKL